MRKRSRHARSTRRSISLSCAFDRPLVGVNLEKIEEGASEELQDIHVAMLQDGRDLIARAVPSVLWAQARVGNRSMHLADRRASPQQKSSDVVCHRLTI